MADAVVATRAALAELLGGYMRTQAIAVVAHLGVADAVGDEPVGIDELAARAGADAPTLYRVLRLLASHGIFAEAAPRAFVRTRLSDGLRSDARLSARHTAMFWASEPYRVAGELLAVVRTGEPAAERVLGMPFFDHLAEDPAASDTFNRAMAGGAGARATAALEHDWAGHATVADIGGGDGSLLRVLLAAHPHLRGVVFDLPHVAAEAERAFAAAGLGGRATAVGGDFFADAVPPADVHVLAQILHDWDDDRAIAILRGSRAALAGHGRLLVIELIVPDGDDPSFAKELDLLILTLVGGRERSEPEWRALLRAGGFDLVSITPVAGTNLLEAVPAA